MPDPITNIVGKVELDLGNYAHRLNGGTVTGASANASLLTDGLKTHFKGGSGDFGLDGSVYESGDFPQSITIDFDVDKYINRIIIYGYPADSLYQTIAGVSASGLKAFSIFYKIAGVYYKWSALIDGNADYGLPATTISGGDVTGNTATMNVFKTPTALLISGIKISIDDTWDVNFVRLCEIECYHTIDITEYVATATPNARRDFDFKRYVGAELILALKNYDRRFSPSKTLSVTNGADGTYLTSEIRPGLNMRIFLGNAVNTIIGHYTVDTWKVNAKDKLVDVTATDIVKQLMNKKVDLPTTIISNQDLEYLMEYVCLNGNIPTAMTDIVETDLVIPYFFPQDVKCWETLQKLSEAVVDSALYINTQGRVQFKYFANALPHEVIEETRDEFVAGSLDNIATEIPVVTDKITIVKPNRENTKEQFDAGIVSNCITKAITTAVINGSVSLPRKILIGTSDFANLPSSTTEYYYSQRFYNEIAGTLKTAELYAYAPGNDHVLYIELWSCNQSTGMPVSLIKSVLYGFMPSSAQWVSATMNVDLNYGTYYAIVGHVIPPNPLTTGELYGRTSTVPAGWYNKMYFSNTTGTLGRIWINYPSYEQYVLSARLNFDATYDADEYFISQEYDTGIYGTATFGNFIALDSVNSAGATIKTYATYEIGTYAVSGTLWADILPADKETITTGNTPTITPKRYIKYRVRLQTTDQADFDVTNLTPIFYEHQQLFATLGTYISDVIDCGTLLTSYQSLASYEENITANNYITIYSASSDDGITFDADLLVAGGIINSAVKRYIKFTFVFTHLSPFELPATLSKFVFTYLTGGGTRYNPGIKAVKTENLVQSLSNEYSGDNLVYNKVRVISNPYILQSAKNVFEVIDDFIIVATGAQTLNVSLTNPCLNDATMTLHIIAESAAEQDCTAGGTFTFGGKDLTVTFTKHPTLPIIVLESTSGITINNIRINAKEYLQTSPVESIAEDLVSQMKYGILEYIYNNEYVNTQSMANSISKQLLTLFGNPVTIIDQPVQTTFDETLDINDVVIINEDETGINTNFEIIGVSHPLTIEPDNFDIKTRLQLREIVNRAFGYWGIGLYWGSKNGQQQYWGGSITG